MIGAALYLMRRTFANGLRRRLSRLREPRYMIAFAVGLAYFYFFFGRSSGSSGTLRAATGDAGVELLIAWFLLLFVVLNWVFGESRTPLPFSQAETQFLFTAPLTRRQVIAFKLLRLQLPLLVSAAISVLLFSRGHITPMRALQTLGAWLLLTTMSLHFAAASFVRANLAEHGITGVRRQAVVLVTFAALVGLCLWSLRRTIPELSDAAAIGMPEFWAAVGDASQRGALAVLLFPFRLAVAPAAAGSVAAFAAALPGSLALIAAHYLWVVHSAIHFEEVAIEDAQRRARRIEAARRGRSEIRTSKGKLRRPIYRLRPVGPPAEAFLWKSLLAVTRQIGRRAFVLLAVGTAAVALVTSQSGQRGAAGLSAGAVLIAMAGIAVLFGPRALRQDLREDLLLLDVLKSYPVRGRDIVLGEVLGLTSALTVFAWVAAGIGFALLAPFAATRGPLGPWALAFVCGLLIVPGIVLVQVTTQNAFAVFFPAWAALGAQTSAGLERFGQQILVMVGGLFLLVVTLIPAAIVGAIVGLMLQGLGETVATVAAVATGSALLLFEGYLGIMLVGARLERTDPADVVGPE